MSETDSNGFPIREGHNGHTWFSNGEMVWVLERVDGTVYGVWESRHDAVGFLATECDDGLLQANRREWFEIKAIGHGEVRPDDFRMVSDQVWR